MRLLLVLGSVSILAAGTAVPDLPLSFERNVQHFYARAGSHTVSLSPRAIRLQSGSGSLLIRFAHANPAAALEALDPLPGMHNYISGRDPKRWITGVSTYARVRYKQLYRGIDLICHGTAGRFEYDFQVLPGADPARIRLAFDPVYAARIEPNGDLVLSDGDREWRQHAPHVYQGATTVAGRYVKRPHGEFGFEIGAYDRTQALVIDPVVTQVTYVSGSRGGALTSMTLDSAGNIYLTGYTNATDFPVTSGAYNTQYVGGPCPVSEPPFGTFDTYCSNVFVTKLNPTGTALIYSTYVGGSGNDSGVGDQASAIAVDSQGNAYVTGTTYSTDFPITPGALQQTNPQLTNFLFQLDPSGSKLLYSTYLGNSADQVSGLAASSSGVLYVAGTTRDAQFPVVNALQSQFNKGDCNPLTYYNGGGPICSYAFLMQWHLPDMTLKYSTFLGGSSDDAANGVATDAAGNAYLAGFTLSPDFPLVNAIQSVPGGGPCPVSATIEPPACSDAFVMKVNPTGTAIVYSTLLGGAGTDAASAIAVDSQDNVYVAGYTDSANFPVLNAFQSKPGGGICYTPHGGPVPCDNVFVTKINAQGTALVYSTYAGGAGENEATGIAVDASGNAFVYGNTFAFAGFPITPDALLHCNGAGQESFLMELSPVGALAYSTLFHGYVYSPYIEAMAVTDAQHVYISAGPGPVNLPLASGALQTSFGTPNPNVGSFVNVAVLDLTAASPAGPAIDTGCVLNAAGYNSVINVSNPVTAVSPGEIVAIFGSGLGPAAGASGVPDSQGNFPSSIAGVTVTFNGTPAPLLYAGANQINAIVPFEVAGSQSADIIVKYRGATSAPVEMTVGGSVQGIFTDGAAGSGQAAALNQDGSFNSPSNPAARGSIVSIWATGLGTTNPAFPDGQLTPLILSQLVKTPTLYVHDQATIAQLQYSGQAPGLVAGAVQINFVIPESAPTGPAIAIFIDFLTQPPTIAIQ